MRKKCLRFLPVIISLLFITGCWDALDIEKRDILTAVMIDYKDNKYFFYTEIANISGVNQKNAVDSKSSFGFITSKGKTLTETRDDYNRRAMKSLYLGAGRVLVFTDRMAEKGIEEYINRVRGQIDYRKSIELATTSANIKDILNTKAENSPSVGFAIESNIEDLTDRGGSIKEDVSDVLQALAVRKVGFLIPNIKVADNKIYISGYSVFKNDKLIGYIPAKDRKGTIYLLNPKADFYYDVNLKDKRYIVEVLLKKKKINTYYSNNKLKFQVDMSFNAIISFVNKGSEMTQEDVNTVSKMIEEQIKKDIRQATLLSQDKFGCDYLKFYKYFRAYYLKDFEKINWNDVYSKAQMDIKAKVNVVENNIPTD